MKKLYILFLFLFNLAFTYAQGIEFTPYGSVPKTINTKLSKKQIDNKTYNYVNKIGYIKAISDTSITITCYLNNAYNYCIKKTYYSYDVFYTIHIIVKNHKAIYTVYINKLICYKNGLTVNVYTPLQTYELYNTIFNSTIENSIKKKIDDIFYQFKNDLK